MIPCLWYRWRLSNAIDDGRAVPPSVEQHLDRCPACRAFCRAAQMLETRLPQTVDPGSDAQAVVAAVMARLTQAGTPTPALHRLQPTAGGRRLWGPPLAVVAAGLLILATVGAVTWWINHRSGHGAHDPAAALAQIFRESVPVGDAAVPDPTALGAVVTQPYARELEWLGREAVSNLRFVASCVGIDLQTGRFPLTGPEAPPER